MDTAPEPDWLSNDSLEKRMRRLEKKETVIFDRLDILRDKVFPLCDEVQKNATKQEEHWESIQHLQKDRPLGLQLMEHVQDRVAHLEGTQQEIIQNLTYVQRKQIQWRLSLLNMPTTITAFMNFSRR